MGVVWRTGEIRTSQPRMANTRTRLLLWTLRTGTILGLQLRVQLMAVDSVDQSKMKMGDILRRLSQNGEAGWKSSLRKKAYVQQLENSRLRLVQLEQGVLVGSGHSADYGPSVMGNGAIVFDVEHARWLDKHWHLVDDLKSGLSTQMNDSELRIIVDDVMIHYDEVLKLKKVAMKADVFYVLSGMWKTPTERCFIWLGGFRSSELLNVMALLFASKGVHELLYLCFLSSFPFRQLEPLTEQQVMGICNLQQSSQQAEDALSQGMEALQQSLGCSFLQPLYFCRLRQCCRRHGSDGYCDEQACNS
ncbi:hypothetical protein MLD38_004393 [Melastoma candidum]|uniref:Uncharacterized protein n=1 Tax=Melastoma candidum TaxID=119954 RepID=A0ACB9S6W1_9MYRT|nr:hypothetical protein MLD38_004393 [Melastoma candidum]